MNLKRFARNISALGAKVETSSNVIAQKAYIAAGQAVVLHTPVDTGRARGNWQGSAKLPITVPKESLKDQNGQDTIVQIIAIAKTKKPDQILYLTNNVHYIGLLNQGSSAQAPANFVQLAVAAGVSTVRGARVL